MTRDEVKKICIRVNEGEDLEQIVDELNTKVCYIESLIKEYGFKYSTTLKVYYSKEFEAEILSLEKEQKSRNVIDDIENMWLKRYWGIDVEQYEEVIEEEWADDPRVELEITLNHDLYSELMDISKENGIKIDFIIEQNLLKMLERNRETRTSKQKKQYLRYLCEDTFAPYFTTEQLKTYTSEERLKKTFLQQEKYLKELEKNIKRKGFLIKPLTYKNAYEDFDIYRKSYLIDKGYTRENIKEIEGLDKTEIKKLEFEGEILDLHYLYKRDEEYKNMSYQEIKEIVNDIINK